MFQGALTAMITPFRSGRIDEERLRANVRWQIEQGINGLVPVGTTGESPTLSREEHRRVIEIVVKETAGRVPVVAGAGSNSTANAVALTREAHAIGADATLQVNPYYNKPTQEGLYRHFSTIADSVDLPIVLYNIPSRCAVGLTLETIERLAKHPNIVAIKEAGGSVDFAASIVDRTNLTVLSGDDALTLDMMRTGAKGVVSVVSNIAPSPVLSLTKAALQGRWEEARTIHHRLMPLFEGLFIETNPIPVKAAMKLMALDSGELRLPLCDPAPETLAILQQALRTQGLI